MVESCVLALLLLYLCYHTHTHLGTSLAAALSCFYFVFVSLIFPCGIFVPGKVEHEAWSLEGVAG